MKRNRLRQFLLFTDPNVLNPYLVKHIQYNFERHLKKIETLSFVKIRVVLVSNLEDPFPTFPNDHDELLIKALLPEGLIANVNSRTDIYQTYCSIIDSLMPVWVQNEWNTKELNAIAEQATHAEIPQGIFGKQYSSKLKDVKSHFYIRMYPEYFDYSIRFVSKKKTLLKVEIFFKGVQSPELLFGFFRTAYWNSDETFILSDLNKEIFFVFSLQSQQYSLQFRPIFNSSEKLESYVNALRFDTNHVDRISTFVGNPD